MSNYLIIGHDPYSTSTFSRITKHVIDYLSKDKDNSVYCLSLGESVARHFGNVLISPVTDFQKQIHEAITYSKPDIVITICDILDTFHLYYYKIFSHSKNWRWVGIFDIQTMPPPPMFINVVLEMDYVLTYSSGIYDFLFSHEDINIMYASLGVESNLFYQLPNQEEICKNLFENNKFLILSPGSNNESNYKIGLIEAFAEFSKNKDDVYLYFCDRDGNEYSKLEETAWKYPWIVDKVMMKSEHDFKLLENHDLNNLYNSVNVTIDVSVNSHFSLSCLEALACGGKVVMTWNHLNPSNQYPLSDRIETIPTIKVVNRVGGNERYVIIEELVKKINDSYLEYKIGNFKKIHLDEELSKEFSWDKFDSSLKYILKKTLNIRVKEPIASLTL